MRLAIVVAAAVALSSGLGPVWAAEPEPEYTQDDLTRMILTTDNCPPNTTADECYRDAPPKTRAMRFTARTRPTPPPAVVAPAPRPAGGSAPTGRANPQPRPQTGQPAPSQPSMAPDAVSSNAVNILVTFALNSAELTPQARANLTVVARTLNQENVQTLNFQIAGFTDITGTMVNNFLLSNRRAEAVKAFLVARGVDPNRLNTAGYGPRSLADPDNPASPRNRRVELHRLN